MIVQCSKCQTRFKLPDAKVTERGVKLRCTRCHHTFRVRRKGSGTEQDRQGAHLASPSRPRWGGALAVNVLLVALLLGGLGAAALAWGSEGNPPLEALRAAQGLFPWDRTVVARDVSNGLYDTRHGHPVFYVRGEVENRGEVPTRVQVRVEIFEGAQRLRSGVGLAGASASPEELAALASPQDGEALRAQLDARARVLGPGERAPFLLVFVEYPPHLRRSRLQVTAEPEALAGSSAHKAP